MLKLESISKCRGHDVDMIFIVTVILCFDTKSSSVIVVLIVFKSEQNYTPTLLFNLYPAGVFFCYQLSGPGSFCKKKCKKWVPLIKIFLKKKLWGVEPCNFAYRLRTYFPLIKWITSYVLCLVVWIWLIWFNKKINKKT